MKKNLTYLVIYKKKTCFSSLSNMVFFVFFLSKDDIYTYKNWLKCRYLVFFYQGLGDRVKKKNGHVSFNYRIGFCLHRSVLFI